MAKTPYDTDLGRNPANFQPLTPLGFLERAAAVFPAHTAIIHGPLKRSYAEFYARTRRLASALSKRGIKRGDSVSAMLANTPAMLECHYGVPMTQGVLNTLNTRLDAPIIAFSLDHAEAKVVIIDREFSKVMKEALTLCKAKPLVIDYDDPEYSGAGERLGKIEYEELAPGRALSGAGSARRARSHDHAAGRPRRRDAGRGDDARQCGDEGLSQEQDRDREGVCRRLVPHRRSRRDLSGRLRAAQGPLQGHHHFRRREYLVDRGGGRALQASRGRRRRGGGETRRQMGRDAVRFR